MVMIPPEVGINTMVLTGTNLTGVSVLETFLTLLLICHSSKTRYPYILTCSAAGKALFSFPDHALDGYLHEI